MQIQIPRLMPQGGARVQYLGHLKNIFWRVWDCGIGVRTVIASARGILYLTRRALFLVLCVNAMKYCHVPQKMTEHLASCSNSFLRTWPSSLMFKQFFGGPGVMVSFLTQSVFS